MAAQDYENDMGQEMAALEETDPGSPGEHGSRCSEELACLRKLARKMSLSLPLKKAVSVALDELMQATSSDLAVLYLQEQDDILLMGLRPESAGYSEETMKRLGRYLCRLATEKKNPFYSPDIYMDADCPFEECKKAGLRSFVSLPLVGINQNLGVLGLATFEERDFSEQAPFLETLACQLAIALQKLLLHEEALKHAVQLEKNLTESNKTQKALSHSEERFRTVVEDLPALVCRFLADGTLTFVNKNYANYFEKDIGSLIGKDFFQFIPEGERQTVREHFLSLSPENPTITYEHQVIAPNGRMRWQQWTDRAVFDENGQVLEYQSLGRDITERKKSEHERKQLEAHLREAQRMEAIANLAGGIAHQFNNALAVVYGNMGLLQLNYPEDEKIRQYCSAMEMSTQRMAHLTNQLLAYAQGGRYQPTDISLNEFVLSTLSLIEHRIDPAITIETDLSKEASMVNADCTQMQMVLSAVLTNAAEAIDDEGWIWVTTRNERVGHEGTPHLSELNPGNYVRLTIRDEGKGMDESTRDRMFEPFFTTKHSGRGLGMSAVYGIIKNHGGGIIIDSELGKGTAVSIFLPTVEPQRKKEKMPAAEVVQGWGTILVIDDEEMILNMSRVVLEKLGYRVIEARSGGEAVDLAKSFDGEIDLAILDYGLPDTPALKAYRLLKEARPRLKVILCSGYAIGEPIQEILDAGADDFIQKPFSIAGLSAKMRQILDK
jgi:two-component system cell cycle sensor histidine kinase/response regulator CckA